MRSEAKWSVDQYRLIGVNLWEIKGGLELQDHHFLWIKETAIIYQSIW